MTHKFAKARKGWKKEIFSNISGEAVAAYTKEDDPEVRILIKPTGLFLVRMAEWEVTSPSRGMAGREKRFADDLEEANEIAREMMKRFGD